MVVSLTLFSLWIPAIGCNVIIKTNYIPSVRNGPVQKAQVEESILHKWVKYHDI